MSAVVATRPAGRRALAALKQLDLERMHASAGRASALLKAMANESRLMILCQLADGEMSVGDLQDIVGLSQSALSQHLAVLRDKGIVATRREAQTIYYSLTSGEAAAVIKTLYDQFCNHEHC
jgi:ArsR family transcriptional regulator, virulence genes transcriptional regulator